MFSLLQVIRIISKVDHVNKLSSTTILNSFCSLFFFLVIFALLALPLRWGKRQRGIGQIFSLVVTFVLKFQYLEYINLVYHVLEKPIKLADNSGSEQQQNSSMFLYYHLRRT